MGSFGTAFNFDGIWGGNMYAGGSGAILPNKITSKHSIRYIPDMNSGDILQKVRAHLDSHGYKDVQVRLIGDQPWSTMDFDTDVAHSVEQMFDKFGIPWPPPISRATCLPTASRAIRAQRQLGCLSPAVAPGTAAGLMRRTNTG